MTRMSNNCHRCCGSSGESFEKGLDKLDPILIINNESSVLGFLELRDGRTGNSHTRSYEPEGKQLLEACSRIFIPR